MRIGPLRRGILQARRKRFFADVKLEDGSLVVAHCANTGTMTGLLSPAPGAWIRNVAGPGRKLDWSLELLERPEGMVMAHTHRANALVGEAIQKGDFPEFGTIRSIRPEAAMPNGHGRFDFLVEGSSGIWAVEVKSATLLDPITRVLSFPDAQTSRGNRHLHDLIEFVAEGGNALVVFLASHSGARSFRPAQDIDPEFAASLAQAVQAKVQVAVPALSFIQQEDYWDLQLRERLHWSLA